MGDNADHLGGSMDEQDSRVVACAVTQHEPVPEITLDVNLDLGVE